VLVRNGGLFLLTVASVFLTGYLTNGPWGGLELAVGMLSILVAHEMGHYVACRVYGVDATLPFFIPAPIVSLVGTLGAFIRIRSPIPNRRALFDIGIAGPLAGFVVCLPVLFLGILESRVLPADPSYGIALGEPLLFSWMARALWGPIPDSLTLALGPLGLAAWFGLFVTALNLIPIGQLDGGHITYALLGRHAWWISRVGVWVCVALVYFGPNWLVWAILVRVLGWRHPRTDDDRVPLGRVRVGLGILALLIFVVCFTPNPIVWSWTEAFRELRHWWLS
jgi:membrane-associated protease RseP (regulator of RpoE activity)